ncbi:MAG: DUF4058 family protein [Chloroflexota bacterium]
MSRAANPTNKVPKEGRQKYESKRLKLLGSQTNLVEIDLLRSGTPMPTSIQEEDWTDNRILISRAYQRPYADVYGFGVRDSIPPFPIPLRRGEEEPIVDLNEILHELYDLLSFDLVINYNEHPVPPLRKEDRIWMNELLSVR